MIKKYLSNSVSKIFGTKPDQGLGSGETSQYWTEHNVTGHHGFSDAQDSLAYFDWRNDQYFKYIDLMPVTGQDGKRVMDFGCGPGHDLVGFGVYSKPQKLVGVDLSASSLAEASARLALHDLKVELVQLAPDAERLPFDDGSFDFIHSSGVLHHTPDPIQILRELKRLLRPNGVINVMVYNHDSLWLHLYVAYQRAILQGLHAELDLRSQFTHSTDGEDCPISNCYRPSEWIAICEEAGLKAEFLGAAISMHEAALLPLRFAAIQDRRLPSDSRKFLSQLKLDEFGYPKYNGHYAGVDACYRLTRAG